jgi:hypothetical protein
MEVGSPTMSGPHARIVATFRADDEAPHAPKERFVYHNAGMSGYGSSSYIDGVVLRDRDANTDWAEVSDGVLEERIYCCQNWRHDGVALISSSGGLIEQLRYSSYECCATLESESEFVDTKIAQHCPGQKKRCPFRSNGDVNQELSACLSNRS